jgi:ABC-type nitrate/sulfonate/bicarbonate transport system substrate-binding protein
MMRVSIRLALAAGLAVTLGSGAFAQSANGITTITRASMSRTSNEWPLFVATHKGFFDREKIAVKTSVISPATITSSLIGGAVEIGFIPAYQLVLSVEKGANVVAIGQGLDPAPYFLMVPASIKTIADLKGKTVAAATPRDVYTVVLREVLKKGGLDPDKDVKFFYGSNSNQRFAALLGGAAAAGLLVPPQTGQLEEKGFHSLAFLPDLYPKLTLSLTAVRRDWAEKNSDVLRRFMRAISAANTWLNDPKNKQEAIDILVKENAANEKSAAEAYDLFVVKTANYPNDACIKTEGMEVLLQMLEQMGDVKGKPSVSKFVDKQWCPK